MPRDHENRPSRIRTEAATRTIRCSWVLAALIALAAALVGCGSSSGGAISAPKVAPARTYSLAGFEPSAPVQAGRRTLLSFTVEQPSGQPLTAYRKCCEPHAGVDLIIVRSDDSHVQYDDSDIAADGRSPSPSCSRPPGATGS